VGQLPTCLYVAILLIAILCISDASPATFETPLDARREDDHPDAEEESDKKSHLQGKEAPTSQDDKSSQDSNKCNETSRLVSESKNSINSPQRIGICR